MTDKEILIAQYEKLINWYSDKVNNFAPWPAFFTGEAIGVLDAGKLLGIIDDKEYWELRNKANDRWDAHDEMTASKMGRKGGSAKTEAKANASRENGKKGGRPKKNNQD